MSVPRGPDIFFLKDTEWRWDLRQSPKVHVYLPLLWQALINHCYLPLVAHGAFVLHTMWALLCDGCWQLVSSGAAGCGCTIRMWACTCVSDTQTRTHTLLWLTLITSHMLIKHPYSIMNANFLFSKRPSALAAATAAAAAAAVTEWRQVHLQIRTLNGKWPASLKCWSAFYSALPQNTLHNRSAYNQSPTRIHTLWWPCREPPAHQRQP